MELGDTARIFAALGNEGRLSIFRLIVAAGADGLPSGEVARRAGKMQNTASGSLRILSEAGLIIARRRGRSVIYSATDANLAQLLSLLVQDVPADLSSAAGRAERAGESSVSGSDQG